MARGVGERGNQASSKKYRGQGKGTDEVHAAGFEGATRRLNEPRAYILEPHSGLANW